ncbi:Protein Shroom2 Protein Apxl [Larimichthys crocea]|uniref:Protein Shroom2 Protein Apxl n=1 Tax=Larimichthys crocea TaxID=215358 RepID=A0A6G0IT03_LARCR|nr:Protein Shroom2 Protein Apxl [Larimichthys crocea]
MPGCEAPQPEDFAGSRHSTSSRSSAGPVWHVPEKKKTTSPSPPPPPPPTRSDSFAATKCQPPEDRKSVAGVDLAQENSPSPQTVTKVKYHLPQHSSHIKDSNGYNKHQVTTVLETSLSKSSCDDKGSQRGHNTQNKEFVSYPSSRQSDQRRSMPIQLLPQDVRHHSQASNKICPQANPMLHSLSMDAAGQEARGLNSEESLESKQMRRSDRFATTLRNEIQMRKAKLQKSKSAAALPGTEGETEGDQEIWKSTNENTTPTSADGSFTNTYKGNLREAQARVLKATSFRRKDLEPVLLENPAAEALPNYPSSALTRKDITPLPTVSESVRSKSGPVSGQVTRIGGRKRFPAEKKVRSFSEPDKIHEVGVNEENASSSLDQKLFKESEEPAYSYTETQTETKARSLATTTKTEDAIKGTRSREDAAHKQSILDQQRLGTFAEYEAKWNIQKTETRATGRYRSADNILDPGPEERTKTTCLHERSRSSPSADIYGQKIQVPARKSETKYSHTESKPAEPLNTAAGFSDRGPGDCKVREKPVVEFERYSAPTPPPITGANPDSSRHRAAAATVNHRPTSASRSLTESPLPQPEDHGLAEPPPNPRRKTSALEKPPPPRCPEVDSHETFTGSQSEIFTHCSPNADPNSAFVPTHSAKGDSEQGKGLVDKGQGAVHHLSTSNPQPASSPPASTHRPSGLATMEGQRSPSPQFSPQRLSDKPPVSLQDEATNRMEHVMENQTSAVKKVPIRIVHSEGVTEKENCPFLQHSDPPAVEPEGPGVTRLGSLGAAGQDSVFCAFTRQREPDSTPAAQTDQYMSTVRDHINANSQQQQPDEPGDNRTARLSEDQKREELARDIMGKDKSLADILDQSKMKTTMDLMEGIFPQGEQLLEGAHQRRKLPPKQAVARPAEEREKEDSMAAAVTMVTSSTYYSTSAPKAELLIKMKDMQEQEQEEEDSEDELDIDLANKKQELIDSLSKKLQVLREARESLQEDVLDNNALGDEVEARVQQVCKPNELDKFRMFVGDLDKVVSLLLSLSGRLARVENALNSLEEDATAEERRTLIEKRKLLIRQHEDAKELKENLDRRERLVYEILGNYLPEESLTDYEHFVKMKSALIIEQRKLEDKIKLGEEQLKCLMDSLPIEQRLVF